MAQKKCPKCGEDNPAEAVMCWACYTPLTGGPAAAAAARPPAGKPPGPPGAGGPEEEGEKKKLQLEPKMIGVIAFLVIGGGLGVFLNMPKGGGDDGGGDQGQPGNPPPDGGGGGAPAPAPAPGVSSPGNVTAPGEGAANIPPAVALPYTPVVPPNPRQAKATIGIVPSQAGSISDRQAASLARFAKNQYQKSGQWSSMQIFVFSSQSAAQSFGDYQARKRGTPLSTSDYQTLANQNVWNSSPACFESSGKKEFVYYPAKNPMSWWSGRKSG